MKKVFLHVFIFGIFALVSFLSIDPFRSNSPIVYAQGGDLSGPVINTSGISANPSLGYDYPVTAANCPANAYLMCNVTSRFGTQRIRCPGPATGEACTRTGTNAVSCRVRFTTEGTWSIQANCGASAPDVGGRYSPTSQGFNVTQFNPAPSGPPNTSPAPSDNPETTIPPNDPNQPPGPGEGSPAPEAPTPTPTPQIICRICDDEYRFYVKAIDSCCKTRDCAVSGTDRSAYVKPAPTETCEAGKEVCYDGRGCNKIPNAKDPPCYDAAGNPIEETDGVCPQVKLGDASIPGLFLSTNAGDFIGQVLGILLSVSGMVAVALIIRSGYQFMTSRGNPDAIQEARDRLTSAIIGLLFIIFSLVILQVIGVDILKIPGFGN